MSLAANYSLLQKKFSRPMAKHRQARLKANEANDTKLLLPPSHGPTLAGVHIPPSEYPGTHYGSEIASNYMPGVSSSIRIESI